ncbi:hypothetical protein B0I35DRAFT_443589 [Stachybotrys elegans]|uniref:Uncharacterized protein n=1 Tax=Stachybotrys elegans TaxID=80388 RepID=A0A8K0SK29_9HYPO|nr:hypothetical protein B0I35DRAFT_443589 [Stachybotrys elegans]
MGQGQGKSLLHLCPPPCRRAAFVGEFCWEGRPPLIQRGKEATRESLAGFCSLPWMLRVPLWSRNARGKANLLAASSTWLASRQNFSICRI